MQDEIKYIYDLFSSMGGGAAWAIVAFMVYKLSYMGFVTFGINQSIKALVKLFGTDIPKSQLVSIKEEFERKISNNQSYIETLQKSVAEKQAELERVIHMHKMMKEAHDAKSNGAE